MKMRHELKHQLNYGDAAVVRSRLGAILARDAHAGEGGRYRVRSLYFDTPDDRALREKLDSVDRREKFRVRRYPGGGALIMLEKKIKIRGLCAKFSAPLTEGECARIIGGDVSWMAYDDRPLLREFHYQTRCRLMTPKAVVEYLREPFVYAAGNVRVTFDTGLCASARPRDFGSESALLVPAGDGMVILEVKYDEYLPAFIEDILQVGSRRAAACSKYAIGRGYV
ncbi:MAG: polyphosphate polymerase domain-containing protein [Clostridiales Family XIII bacterium]|jgi:hypothetical protein|nr:polyphosphate polymerase domain-containing protein [Clostridiales Family XIII bacterium]